MCAEGVILHHAAPVGVDHTPAALLRADAVAPVIAGDEVPAGPAQQRQPGLLEQPNHVRVRAANMVAGIEQRAVEEHLGGRIAGDGKPVERRHGSVSRQAKGSRERLPLRPHPDAGARGRVRRGRGAEAERQLAWRNGARHDAEQIRPGAVQRQICPLPDPAPCFSLRLDFDPLRPAAVGAGVRAKAHLVGRADTEPAESPAVEISRDNRLRIGPGIALRNRGNAPLNFLAAALRAHAAVRMFADRETPLPERAVQENLGFHSVVYIGAQVLAELPEKPGIDRMRGAPPCLDGQGCPARRRSRLKTICIHCLPPPCVRAL